MKIELEYCDAEPHLTVRQLKKIRRHGCPWKFRYFQVGFELGFKLKISVEPK